VYFFHVLRCVTKLLRSSKVSVTVTPNSFDSALSGTCDEVVVVTLQYLYKLLFIERGLSLPYLHYFRGVIAMGNYY